MKDNHTKTVKLLISIYALKAVAANLAHPITPSLLAYRGMPNYMFGIVFAAMAFTNFAFSPFWGNLCNIFEARKLLLLGCVGYAMGQGLFAIATGPILMTFARFVSGLFVSCVAVSATYYVIQFSDETNRSRNITMTITAFTVAGTFGFFVGGYIGTTNMFMTFILQCILLTICGILFYALLEPNETLPTPPLDALIRKSNPVQAFTQIKPSLTPLILSLFITVLVASTASTSLTQTFQYYVQNALGLSPFINGIAKGLVGLIATGFNFTITLWILRRHDVEQKLSLLYALMVSIFMLLGLMRHNAYMFIGLGIVLMVLDTMQVSVLQDRNAAYASPSNQGVMLGMHNAMKSLGMIGGSLISGFIYEFNPFYPFIFAMVLYGVAVAGTQFMKQRSTTYEKI